MLTSSRRTAAIISTIGGVLATAGFFLPTQSVTSASVSGGGTSISEWYTLQQTLSNTGEVISLVILASLPLLVALLVLSASLAATFAPPDPCVVGLTLAAAGYELVILALSFGELASNAASAQHTVAVGLGAPALIVGYILAIGGTVAQFAFPSSALQK